MFVGFACIGTGLTVVSQPCNEGFYCPGGQDTNTPADYECPQGFYCPEGSAEPLICERGWFS